MVRTTITLSEKDFKEIKSFCKAKDVKLSSIFRRGAKKIIEEENAR